ncbi:MAG: enoyl-CoA hydratase/isomerase family protein, partial [Dehalococcoidia bacterium]
MERTGPLAVIRLARPEQGNPIDRLLLQELDDACAAVNDDAEVRIALVTAEGEVFSRGWAEDELANAVAERRAPPFACLEAMGQPAICAMSGDATSAGLELALACDVRLA